METPSGQSMQVFVKALNGKTITLHQLKNTNETIHRLKHLVHAKTGIPPVLQRLVYSSRILKDDDKTLSDYNIDNESTLYLSTPLTINTTGPDVYDLMNYDYMISFYGLLLYEQFADERSTVREQRPTTNLLIDEVDLSGDISAKLRAFASSKTTDWQSKEPRQYDHVSDHVRRNMDDLRGKKAPTTNLIDEGPTTNLLIDEVDLSGDISAKLRAFASSKTLQNGKLRN